ncbi:unnamed protein product [Prunus armeniaca]
MANNKKAVGENSQTKTPQMDSMNLKVKTFTRKENFKLWKMKHDLVKRRVKADDRTRPEFPRKPGRTLPNYRHHPDAGPTY